MLGLKPVLEGRRIESVTLRRNGLRFPFPQGFCGAAFRAAGHQPLAPGQVHPGRTRLGRTPARPPRHDGAVHGVLGAGRAQPRRILFRDGGGRGREGPHDHVVLRLDDGTRVVYTDPRRFGIMDLLAGGEAATHKLLSGIGVSPWATHSMPNTSPTDSGTRPHPQGGSPRPAYCCRPRQHLCLRGAVSVGPVTARKARTLVRKKGHDPRLDDLVRHIREVLNEAILRRLDIAGLRPHRWGVRRLPAALSRLRPRGGSPARNAGRRSKDLYNPPFHLLLPDMPALGRFSWPF